jgi:hypothetical protein
VSADERLVAELSDPDGRSVVLLARIWEAPLLPPPLLLVVVSFEQQPGRIITAVATRKDPKRWKR